MFSVESVIENHLGEFFPVNYSVLTVSVSLDVVREGRVE